MKKLDKKGFTLIELLAVIVIMGILMMVAIPAMMRYIDNSRKDTFINTTKECVNAVKNSWLSGSITCGDVSSDGVADGKYYLPINGTTLPKLLESGGKSPWGSDLSGYVLITVTNAKASYSVRIADGKEHGVSVDTPVDSLTRDSIVNSAVSASAPSSTANATACTLS